MALDISTDWSTSLHRMIVMGRTLFSLPIPHVRGVRRPLKGYLPCRVGSGHIPVPHLPTTPTAHPNTKATPHPPEDRRPPVAPGSPLRGQVLPQEAAPASSRGPVVGRWQQLVARRMAARSLRWRCQRARYRSMAAPHPLIAHQIKFLRAARYSSHSRSFHCGSSSSGASTSAT